jgi:hypothetical protein
MRWLLASLICTASLAGELPTAKQLEQLFRDPPMEYRPRTRYWWFGGAVTREELARELKGMKEQGLAGVEIQSLYDATPLVSNHTTVTFASPEWADRVAMCIEEAAKLGLKVDLTPGSGWPYAGPWVDDHHAGQSLQSNTVALGESFQPKGPVIAVFTNENSVTYFWAKLGGVGPHKRSNPRDKGPVLDHLSASAMDFQLNHVVQPVLDRAGQSVGHTFEALFFDSWELGQPTWTTDFLEEFRKRRGYDLKPHLPELATSPLVKWDYQQTLRELVVEDCYGALTRWCHAHGLKSRAQAHGSPSDWVDSYGASDIPEFEMQFKEPTGAPIGASDAVSAAHLYDRPLVSCESFTWLNEHWRVTMQELRQRADDIFSLGANQLVFHGYNYSPPEAGFPGWTFYASCEINHNNPFWPYFRPLADYMARHSVLLRAGRPVVDVCVYGSPLELPGHRCDRLTDRTIERAARYRALIVNTPLMPVETAEKIRALADNGLTVVPRQLPSEAPGFLDHDARTARLREIVATFDGRLELEPQLTAEQPVRWLHRQGADYDLFLLNNPSRDEAVRQTYSFRATGALEIWNARTGRIEAAPHRTNENRIVAEITLEPASSRLVVIRRDGSSARPAPVLRPILTLTEPWEAQFPNAGKRLRELVDWTSFEELQHFAGTATYRTRFRLRRLPKGETMLDLGRVCDVASVSINGKPAGIAFEPPYRVEVTGLLRVGENELVVNVANRAENGITPDNWKPGYFFVNRDYKDYDPGKAQVHPSGLLGPVRLLAP